MVASSVVAKFRALAQDICEGIWIRRLLKELRFSQTMPMCIYCDYKVTVPIADNPILHNRTKHIEVDKNFIKENILGISSI